MFFCFFVFGDFCFFVEREREGRRGGGCLFFVGGREGLFFLGGEGWVLRVVLVMVMFALFGFCGACLRLGSFRISRGINTGGMGGCHGKSVF